MAGCLAKSATGAGVFTVDELRGEPGMEVTVGGGKIGGTITADDFLGAHDALWRQCACAGVDPLQPVLEWAIEEAIVVSCTDNTGDPNACDSEDICSQRGTVCGFIGLWGNFFDVDVDDDEVRESLSVGLRVALSGVKNDGLLRLFQDGFELGTTGSWSSDVP